ncbi:MAG: tRNA pseudouridine(38-40) synthase TruA [Candidatus Omnitrophica bacterium]|nr:tRNA pseudouridine(38-40) synthase TruA [Candidatus Omnitrophota bacterium]
MTVFKLVVSYRGTDFCGWQKQNNGNSLQEIVEEALGRILCEPTGVIASGRTDAGVHSLGQVVAFKTSVNRSAQDIRQGLNGVLPDSVRVLSAQKASDDFHPQFQAKKKAYRYLVQNTSAPNPLISPYAYFFPKKLNLTKMRQAAAYLVGRYDFTAFQASGRKVNDPVRTVYSLTVKEESADLFQAAGLVGITIVGSGFLYKMVRNIAGTLLEVGRGKIKPEAVREILESGDRRKAGKTMPARGLTLLWVEY